MDVIRFASNETWKDHEGSGFKLVHCRATVAETREWSLTGVLGDVKSGDSINKDIPAFGKDK